MRIALNLPNFKFDNSFKRDLTDFFIPWNAEKSPNPQLLLYNSALSSELGLKMKEVDQTITEKLFSGNMLPNGAEPIVQVYAGHQFGGFSPQLGDGRALLLGEIIDPHGLRWDMQLKGSGPTPFARDGDGKAPLDAVLREYLISEAMHAMRIPTTRALAAIKTGEVIFRRTKIPGAILTRIASSHLRVGTFQFFAARGADQIVKKLLDYTIKRHYPYALESPVPALAFFDSVTRAQSILVSKWMSIGFIHGVMNTDNTTISGETIDYGPCAFMDEYNPHTVFSSIDTHGRYSYSNQLPILVWNLARLAETLVPHINEKHETAINILTERINVFSAEVKEMWIQLMIKKIGLEANTQENVELVTSLLSVMEKGKADFTLTFHYLSDALEGNTDPIGSLFENPRSIYDWKKKWKNHIDNGNASKESCLKAMNSINPIYIPRNHMVEEALKSATENDDMSKFNKLLKVVTSPFKQIKEFENYKLPNPNKNETYQTFCGT